MKKFFLEFRYEIAPIVCLASFAFNGFDLATYGMDNEPDAALAIFLILVIASFASLFLAVIFLLYSREKKRLEDLRITFAAYLKLPDDDFKKTIGLSLRYGNGKAESFPFKDLPLESIELRRLIASALEEINIKIDNYSATLKRLNSPLRILLDNLADKIPQW